MLTIVIPSNKCDHALQYSLDSLSNILSNELKCVVIFDRVSSSVARSFSQQYCRKNLKFIHARGPEIYAGGARNVGLRETDTEYVMFLDSGDALNVVELDNLMKFLERSSSDVIHVGIGTLDRQKQNQDIRQRKYSKIVREYNKYKDKKILLRFVVPWARIFKTQFLKNNNITFDIIQYSNDVMFSMNCLLATDKISSFEDAIYLVASNSRGLTSVKDINSYNQRFSVFLRQNKLIKENFGGQYQIGFFPKFLSYTARFPVLTFKRIILCLAYNIPIIKVRR